MKFRIIASIVFVVIVIILTAIFGGVGSQETPSSGETIQFQP